MLHGGCSGGGGQGCLWCAPSPLVVLTACSGAVPGPPPLASASALQNMLASQGRNTVRVNRIVEGAETPLFKSKFYQWDPPASFDFTAPRSAGVAGVRGRTGLAGARF